MTDKLKELAARLRDAAPIPTGLYAEAADAILALITDLENEQRKVTELVDGYEKDQAELKRLRTTIFTDNSITVRNAEKYAQACQDEADELRSEVERLKDALQEYVNNDDVDLHLNGVKQKALAALASGAAQKENT